MFEDFRTICCVLVTCTGSYSRIGMTVLAMQSVSLSTGL